MKKENDILEEALAIAGDGYMDAYRFLLGEYEKAPAHFGPQALYFLACLAGGAGMPEKALEWTKAAISDHGWWYRPEVLEDDDLAAIRDDAAFVLLKAISDERYRCACEKAQAVFSWERKCAANLLIAVHGNTQNAQTAREDWEPFGREHPDWQIETVQSAEPDGYGTYRWSYEGESFLPVAKAMERVQQEGYRELACGGFSAGCDMLLRAVTFTPVRCDRLILQSPWVPVLQSHAKAVGTALREKDIALVIRCGAEDEDCLPMARALQEAAEATGVPASLTIQPGCRHQFPD